MKDYFSTKSDLYKKYRPSYPSELFDFILSNVVKYDNAWDCGTGNGQIVKNIHARFSHVFATDISQSQIGNAEKFENVSYSLQAAEETTFKANFFDLITVGQAVHWFDFEKFYVEVNRTAVKNGIIAIMGYGRVTASDSINPVIDDLYENLLAGYWDPERKYIDENYQTLPFPFKEIKTPTFSIAYNWTLEELRGYLETWSAVKHYKAKNTVNPLDLISDDLQRHWGKSETIPITFPVITRIGSV